MNKQLLYLLALSMFPIVSLTKGIEAQFSNWTEIHGGQAHSGYSSVEIAPPLKLLWKANISPDDHMSVVGCRDEGKPRIFTADSNGSLLCLYPSDATEIWKFVPSRGLFHASPIIADLNSGKKKSLPFHPNQFFRKKRESKFTASTWTANWLGS